MELNIGDYIRTNDGLIEKIEENLGYTDFLYHCVCYKTDIENRIQENAIVKHSKNIIDLIEVGDYVNGCKVITILDGFVDGTMEIKLENTTKIYRTTAMEDIKNIVTKEQFKNVMYEV